MNAGADLGIIVGGGVLIGLASALLLAANGRILGVSGVLGGALTPRRSDFGWRLALLAGLAAGGILLHVAMPSAFDAVSVRPLAWTVAAGFLVGFGTRLGNGCTSGHGICGTARLAPRSLAATATFVAVGILTATALRLAGVVP